MSATPTPAAPPAFRDPQVNVYVRDLAASLRFYGEVLGLPETFRTPKQGPPDHVELRLLDLALGLATRDAVRRDHGLTSGEGPPRGDLVLWVDDADAAYAYLTKHGARSLREPHNFGNGAYTLRSGRVADPDGNPVQVTSRVGDAPRAPSTLGPSAPRVAGSLLSVYAHEMDPTLRFYRDQLGMAESFRVPTTGPPEHVEVRSGPLTIGVSSLAALERVHGMTGGGGPPRFETVFWVDDVDRAQVWLTGQGAPRLAAPHNFAGVLRSAWVADPEGNPVQLVMRRGPG